MVDKEKIDKPEESSEEISKSKKVKVKKSIQLSQKSIEIQEAQENQEVREEQEEHEVQEMQGADDVLAAQENREVREEHEDEEILAVQENQEVREDHEVEEVLAVQENQEVREDHEVEEIQGSDEVLAAQEIQESQVDHEVQEMQGVNEVLAAQENQEVQEEQEIQEIQGADEVLAVQENQEVREEQEIQEIQGADEVLAVQENQEVHEDQETQEVLSAQEIQESQVDHEVQEIQGDDDVLAAQEIQESQVDHEVEEIQGADEVLAAQENLEVREDHEVEEIQGAEEVLAAQENQEVREDHEVEEMQGADEVLAAQENQEVREDHEVEEVLAAQENQEVREDHEVEEIQGADEVLAAQEELNSQSSDDVWDDDSELLDWEQELDPEKQMDKIIHSYKEIHEKNLNDAIEKLKSLSPTDPALEEFIKQQQVQSEQLMSAEEPVAEDTPTFSFTAEELNELLSDPPLPNENTPQISISPFEISAINDEDKRLISAIEKIDNPEEIFHPDAAKFIVNKETLEDSIPLSEPVVQKDEPRADGQELSAVESHVELAEASEQTKKFSRQAFNLNEESALKALRYLQQTIAYAEIRIEDARLTLKNQPVVIKPAPLVDDPKNNEFVYPIFDYNDRLITSKSLSHEEEGMGMYKMFQTIEKMILIMHRRLADLNSTGQSSNDEVRVFIDGQILCKRKMFEVIINLTENWVVINFEPGQWGNNYLDGLQKLYKKGFPYPPAAPRTSFQHKPGTTANPPGIQVKS
jgi:hypothetical protein